MTDTKTEKFVENTDTQPIERKAWISVLSKAKPQELIELWDGIASHDVVSNSQILRPPETGMVMVRGRTGGAGGAFNLGEMTVTRCAVRLKSGVTGIGYVSGRNKKHSQIAALVDAMMQSDGLKPIAENGIIAPLKLANELREVAISKKAKATQVEFFTMVRDRKV